MVLSAGDRFALVSDTEADQGSFAEDVAQGLQRADKKIPSRWFYDANGSWLFEQICELPEYYPTRAERSILERSADEIAQLFATPTTLIELGCGSAVKTRLLIEAFLERHGEVEFAPIDISRTMLEETAVALLRDYPELSVRGFAGTYENGLAHLASAAAPPRLILWLGSSIGNMHRAEAAAFVRKIVETMTPNDRLLIGIDLRKDGDVLERAYDDAQGVTAAFDLNLLTRINRELGGDFDLDGFAHEATWVESPGRVESHLRSRQPQKIRIDDLSLDIEFAAGETIHTENSYKYSHEEIESLARDAGVARTQHWLDPQALFSLNLFEAATPGRTPGRT